MNYDTPLVRKLRDHLLGLSRESLPPTHGGTKTKSASPEERAVMNRFRPFAELFYLVAISDGEVDDSERAVMLGAFRALTDGRVRGALLQDLESELCDLRLTDGVESRLEAVCSELSKDREDQELALTLAAAIAMANNDLDESESKLMSQLASWLGVSATRQKQLIESGRNSTPPASA